MPTLNAPPIAKSLFTVTTTAFPGTYFTKFSGLDDKAETSTYADGLDLRMYYVKGLAKLSEMTLELPFSPGLNSDIIMYQKNNPCSRFITVVTPAVCKGNIVKATGKNVLYLTSCQMTGVKAYEADLNSSELSYISLTFVADDYYLG